ncbi:MAG: copper resistance protein NlpE [Oxalobacter formigenes]|nr:copper resistance protein NlpE [Oxalobacter formigenes]
MKKLLVALAVLGLFLVGCHKKETASPKPAEQETASAAQTTTAAPAATETVNIVKTYEGVLPCADCSGIKTRVKIRAKADDPTANLFEVTETYMGKEPDNVFVTTGKYTVQRGIGDDNNATVYIFTPEQPAGDTLYYAVYSNDPATLHLLDRDMKKVESDLNYTLKLAD